MVVKAQFIGYSQLPIEAEVGQIINTVVTINNIGDATGTLYAEFKDMNTGQVITRADTEFPVDPTYDGLAFISFKMPNNDIAVRVFVGHKENEIYVQDEEDNFNWNITAIPSTEESTGINKWIIIGSLIAVGGSIGLYALTRKK